jgi:hypothetical protein
MAIVTVMMTSKHDILNLHASLMAIDEARMNGSLRGIPLVLRRVEKKISTPRDGKRVRVTKWLLQIEAQPRWVALQLQAQERAALPGYVEQPREVAPLQIGPAPDPIEWEIDEDGAEVEDGVIEPEEVHQGTVEAPAGGQDQRGRCAGLVAQLESIGVPRDAIERKIAVMARGVCDLAQVPAEDLGKVEQMLGQFAAMGAGAVAAMTGSAKGARK